MLSEKVIMANTEHNSALLLSMSSGSPSTGADPWMLYSSSVDSNMKLWLPLFLFTDASPTPIICDISRYFDNIIAFSILERTPILRLRAGWSVSR